MTTPTKENTEALLEAVVDYQLPDRFYARCEYCSPGERTLFVRKEMQEGVPYLNHPQISKTTYTCGLCKNDADWLDILIINGYSVTKDPVPEKVEKKAF